MDRVSESAVRAQTNMSIPFPTPDHMPCPECGASVAVSDGAGSHLCDHERRVDYRLLELHPAIEQFDSDLAAWLDSPAGRFEQWLAERNR